MNDYLFKILHPEKAKEELLKHGLQNIYELEDSQTGELFLGGQCHKAPKNLLHSALVKPHKQAVDWEEQWSLFAENFSEGKAHINLRRFGKKATLLLNPGPGFGDLSHPTTELMLKMMRDHVHGASIVDIGTGSGILALAALLLGASSAIGTDIDPQALKHARLNAKTNHLDARFVKKLPHELYYKGPHVCLLNMIFSEQQAALRPIKQYNRFASMWITSGILVDQKEKYLQCAQSWGWQLKEIYKKKQWLGFIFLPRA